MGPFRAQGVTLSVKILYAHSVAMDSSRYWFGAFRVGDLCVSANESPPQKQKSVPEGFLLGHISLAD